jgi:hypothetical protein
MTNLEEVMDRFSVFVEHVPIDSLESAFNFDQQHAPVTCLPIFGPFDS